MAKGDDIEQRLISFAVRIVRLSTRLPNTQAGKHISGQLLRSGTAPAAHYAEARAAESTNDFIHKLKICLKELNESRVWLKIIIGSELIQASRLSDIIKENDELSSLISELKKVVTPTRKELINYFFVVLGFVVVMMVLVWLLDQLFGWVTVFIFGTPL